MIGITSLGHYVPSSRLARAAIGQTLQTRPGRGVRSVASYDEDVTSMGVEAARRALRGASAQPDRVVFATSHPPYLDKTNATAVHAALALDEAVSAYDMVGSVRSSVGALQAGLDAARAGSTPLVVLADTRGGMPGGADESAGGDAAVAVLLGSSGVVAEYLGTASATAEFLDRWRLPGEEASHVWEERFGEVVYAGLARTAIDELCKNQETTLAEIDHVVFVGTHDRAMQRLPKLLSAPEAGIEALNQVIGNTGSAGLGLALADVLDRARPGDRIMVLSVADGVDAMLFRATDDLPAARESRVSLREELSAGTREIDYPTFLTWRGMLRREPPRRPDPDRPAAPPSFRGASWKFGFHASRCLGCSTRHLPPGSVCLNCHAVGQMQSERMVDVPATIATFTIDRLAYSLSPPVVVASIDFDGGGRFQCELTDVDADSVRIGDRVEMTFRRLYTAGGVHNYFWKARPLRSGLETEI